ncbi:MAG: hypothetical protein RLN72_04785 [Henriciella sp.]
MAWDVKFQRDKGKAKSMLASCLWEDAMKIVKMLGLVAAALPLIPTAALAQDKPACPTGETGAWKWQVMGSDIQLKNPEFPIGWDTIGGEIATEGFALSINLEALDKEKVRVVRFEVPPLDFKFVRDAGTEAEKTYLMFRSGAISDEELEARNLLPAFGFAMAGFSTEGEQSDLLFQTRVEEWDSRDKRVSGGWASWDNPVDCTFTHHKDFRLVISTPYFTPYGQPDNWSNIAMTKPIDLTELTPIIDNLRVTMLEQSQIYSMCQPDYLFMTFN